MNLEFIITLAFFGCLWLPFAIVGIGFLLYPERAISNATNMAKRFPGFEPNDYPDPYGTGMILLYRLGGLMLIGFPSLPFITMLVLGP